MRGALTPFTSLNIPNWISIARPDLIVQASRLGKTASDKLERYWPQEQVAERVGFELETFCGRLSPQPKSRCNRDHERSGGEGGIRTHGTVPRTLAFEASTFNRSVTSPSGFLFPS